MVHLEEIITVPATPEAAFDYVADFTTTVEWDPGIARATRVAGDDPGVGSRYQVISVFNGRELTLEYETRHHDRPTRLVFAGGNERFESVDTITFEPADGGTRITYAADFSMKGVLRLAEPFLRTRFDEVAKKAVVGLERALSDQA
jgi:carbon monoxide dehydrogenase subunit G